MENKVAVELLESHDIRPTSNRIVILDALLSSTSPMSLAELEDEVQTIDKSNIFRALCVFRDKHLVHVIEGCGDGVKYEVCLSHDSKHDDDAHLHFYCEECQQTYCIYDVKIPEVSIPGGYEVDSASIMVKGVCPKCLQKKPNSKK